MNDPYYDAWDSTPPRQPSRITCRFALASIVALIACARPAGDAVAQVVPPPVQEPARLRSVGFTSGNPILGPTAGQPGDIILLDASQAKAKAYAWDVIPMNVDAQGKPLVTIVPLGDKAIVSSRPGVRTVILSVVDDAGKIALYQWTVTIGGAPTPEPPKPPPDPPKPPPEPLSGLAKVAHDEAAKLTDRSKAPAMAQAFRGLVQRIMDGAVADDVQAIGLIKAATNQALGAQADLWKPWGNAVGAALRVKDPNTPSEWAAAVEQIAVGLESVKP